MSVEHETGDVANGTTENAWDNAWSLCWRGTPRRREGNTDGGREYSSTSSTLLIEVKEDMTVGIVRRCDAR